MSLAAGINYSFCMPETDKVLVSVLCRGRGALFFDNVVGTVNCKEFNATRQTAILIADMQRQDFAEVESVQDGVRAACRRGDRQVIEEALLDQAALLTALGIKLLKVAGNEDKLARIQVLTNLSLRAVDQVRKSLGVLASMNDA
jgi:hypothetical protein